MNVQTSKLENSCKVILEEKSEDFQQVIKGKFDETNLKLDSQNERMEEHKYEVYTKLDAFQSELGEQKRKMDHMEGKTIEMNTK